jgi:hypothetical protein
VVAYAEYTRKSVCIISIDFQGAFDNIAHEYLIATLHNLGFSENMIRRITNLYDNASSMAQINGFMTPTVPINASIRQGCPLSIYL